MKKFMPLMGALVVALAGLGFSFSSEASAAPAQSATDLASGRVTVTRLAQNLFGSMAYVNGASYTGDPHAAGVFSGFQALGVNSGVALSSGAVATDDGYTSSFLGSYSGTGTDAEFGTPGDSDLTSLFGAQSHDAAVLQFSVYPFSNRLTFHYVLGTQERTTFYNEGVGIFVNGVNCATVGTPPVPATLGHLYSNTNTPTWTANTGAYPTSLNGFTPVLTCSAPVKTGVLTRVKIGIADALDDEVDTTVLLQSN